MRVYLHFVLAAIGAEIGKGMLEGPFALLFLDKKRKPREKDVYMSAHVYMDVYACVCVCERNQSKHLLHHVFNPHLFVMYISAL